VHALHAIEFDVTGGQGAADSVDIMDATGSQDLKLWFADGTNYPGQDSIAARQGRLAESLDSTYQRLSASQRLILEYKLFEPAFYSTDVPDWGTAYLHCVRLGEQAKVCVDTGHHAPAPTSSSSWPCCCGRASWARSTSTPGSRPMMT
jgi:L-rhamnose isomerase